MTKIKCVINGQVTEIEVEDSFATAYLEIDAESKRNDWKHEWRQRKYNCSLETITENGYQIAAPDDVAEEAEQAEERAALKAAIAQLTPEQQEIIRRVYFACEKKSDVAKSLGIANSSLTERLQNILKKIKKIMQ